MAETLDYTKRRCPIEGCTIHLDGKCIEGFPLDQCNNHVEWDGTESLEKNEGVTKASEFIDVYSADTLSLNETVGITAKSLTRFIVLAGSTDCGKTTSLATLLDLFQLQQTFGKYLFAASKTLIGFEKRCHDSRLASGRTTPKQERTLYNPEDPRFLHLKLFDKDNNRKQDLIFTDISGEHFQKMSLQTDECKKFTMGNRADHFVLFIDSDTISKNDTRQGCKTESLGLLRSLIESGILDMHTQIQIVFSRWDLLLSKNQPEDHIQFVEEIKNEINRKFGINGRVIRYFQVATRPHFKSKLKIGHGLESILDIWVNESRFQSNASNSQINTIQMPSISKEYLKFNAKNGI